MFKHILIICVGNICRSPSAEFLFRDKLRHRNIQIRSAGLKAMVGYPMDDNAMRVLQEHGIDAAAHRARQLDAAMLREADLVLAMERDHLSAASRLAPEASGKFFLLDKWGGATDIPDPYRRSPQVFEHVHAMIERGVESWLSYL
ncbi:low molecular weight protein-tyrosine-phosphatase [Dyella nitratireducens]|uniref:protein-tyrosine-phosphatase n=1 Tax=Dyella nitratireducens TaxID=1849580 RepID=A0ABQ1GFJ5_9GAMM|nr:low molecular weight protein-tyrosine-phosphatase [Dyella nitratireducens]GGA42820.1 protein-tyrosine-phosphatase [Dyella nitratireducens]GLQ41952.1 protein-tyrosine-phosphatase [Dyella nitratireducens]